MRSSSRRTPKAHGQSMNPCARAMSSSEARPRVRKWIIQEALGDMRIVGRKYPRPGLRDALLQTGIELG